MRELKQSIGQEDVSLILLALHFELFHDHF